MYCKNKEIITRYRLRSYSCWLSSNKVDDFKYIISDFDKMIIEINISVIKNMLYIRSDNIIKKAKYLIEEDCF